MTAESTNTPGEAFIPYGRQQVDEADEVSVADVLVSDYLTCGPKVAEFETALATFCGAKHAIAVSNGTAALHIAMLAAGVGKGDRVLTTTLTFLASANCAEFVGATADFADIDPQTRCLSLQTLARAWKDDVRAVVPVDFAGYPCVDQQMADYAHAKGSLVIEDASHAIGGGRDRHRVGALPWVDMTTFSFHPVKTMTTGEGGAVLTDNDDLAERCRLFRNHGMVRGDSVWEDDAIGVVCSSIEQDQPAEQEDKPWLYAMTRLGFNYRITDLQCVLGLSQLRKLKQFVRRRQAIVSEYNRVFKGLQHVRIPCGSEVPEMEPAWHLYVLSFDFKAMGRSRAEVMAYLKERGIGTQVHYIPVHLQPYYRTRHGYCVGKCPRAEVYYRGCLSLPLYPAMSDHDVERVCRAVQEVVS